MDRKSRESLNNYVTKFSTILNVDFYLDADLVAVDFSLFSKACIFVQSVLFYLTLFIYSFIFMGKTRAWKFLVCYFADITSFFLF